MISGYRSAFARFAGSGETYAWRTELKEWLAVRDEFRNWVITAA